MKPAWIFSGLIFLTSALHAENFYPFQEYTTPNPLHQYSDGKYQKESIEEIISSGTDDELVKISGEIIKKLKGSTYLFRGKTGEIHIHIEESSLPEKGLQLNAPTTIKGEVIREKNKPASIDADRIRYMF